MRSVALLSIKLALDASVLPQWLQRGRFCFPGTGCGADGKLIVQRSRLLGLPINPNPSMLPISTATTTETAVMIRL